MSLQCIHWWIGQWDWGSESYSINSISSSLSGMMADLFCNAVHINPFGRTCFYMCVCTNISLYIYKISCIYKDKLMDLFGSTFDAAPCLPFLSNCVSTQKPFSSNKKIKVQRSIFIKLWPFRLKIKTLQEDGRCSAKEMCLRGRPLNGLLDRMR